jgi:hypothetical protein
MAGRQLRTVSVDGVHVVCQRRPERPRASEAELRAQHALILELAGRVRTILPVRFGTLLEAAELRRVVRAHENEIRQAMDLVRDRVQVTIRVTGRRPAPLAGRPATGRAYLESRRRAGSPRLPKAVAAVLASVAHLAVDERREPGAGPLLATVYHLVAVEDMSRYLRLVAQRPRSMTVTGPWPPFAFAPRFG